MGDIADGLLDSPEPDGSDLEVVCEDVGGRASLADAACKGRARVVRRLLQQRADVNALETSAKACQTPLMAAAAGGSMGVVAALLLAGADPDLQSPSGVAAADLASTPTIRRLLAAVSKEVAAELSAGGGDAPPGSEARREALARVQKRAVPLIEQAVQRPSRRVVSGATDLKGADARAARKQRNDEREAARLQRVAEKAAARRGQDDEEARLQRVAEKAAARRAARKRHKEARAKRRALRHGEGSDRDRGRRRRRRRSRRSAERQGEGAAGGGELAGQGGVVTRKVVTSESFMCPSCSWSGERLPCGVCGEVGVCSGCSTCSLCGRVSGFCAAPAQAAIPGFHGAHGRPEMSGMTKAEEAFPQAAYIRHEKKSKKKKGRSESPSKDRKKSRKADEGGLLALADAPSGEQARSRQPGELDDGEFSDAGSDGSYTYSYCSEELSQEEGSPPP